MKLSTISVVAALCLAISLSASALPLNGYNELRNPSFEEGLAWWQHGADIVAALDGPGQGYAATCKSPGGNTWLRQIVDESLGPEWDWSLDLKLVDLVAKITWSGWEPPTSAISFRLDWWSQEYNYISDPTSLPYYLGPPPAGSDPAAGYFVTEWVAYNFAGVPAFQWVTVNPFNQIVLPEQPRWVSVEVLFDQSPGQSVWLDDVILTGRCVPEPGGFLSLFGATAMVLAGLRMRRRLG